MKQGANQKGSEVLEGGLSVDGCCAQVRTQSAEHEALQVRLCCVLARECAAGNLVVSPGWVRSSLLEALKVTHPAHTVPLSISASSMHKVNSLKGVNMIFWKPRMQAGYHRKEYLRR